MLPASAIRGFYRSVVISPGGGHFNGWFTGTTTGVGGRTILFSVGEQIQLGLPIWTSSAASRASEKPRSSRAAVNNSMVTPPATRAIILSATSIMKPCEHQKCQKGNRCFRRRAFEATLSCPVADKLL